MLNGNFVMAILISGATGNFTASTTWYTCDTTSASDTENTSSNVGTTFEVSQTFTPGAITINAIAFKLSSRISSPTGTFTVDLYNSTDALSVTNTTVTVNVSDMNAGPGWHVFPCSSNVTLLAGKAYAVRAKCSVANEVSLWRTATAQDWSRQLRTTTQAAPGAGDTIHICGEFTGAGTSNSYTVTMDSVTSATAYGNSSTTIPSITVNDKGTLSYGTSASTNYYLKVTGVIGIYGNGTFNIGTSGTRIPSTSTAKLELSSAVNVDFGLIVTAGGNFNAYGNTITTTKTTLTADASAAATILTLGSTSGWANGGEICLAPTSRTYTQHEKRTISTVDSATQVTLTAGITNARSGTSPTQAEIGYLTRNVQIFGKSNTLQGYIYFKDASIVAMDYTEIYFLGSATSLKRGLDVENNSGSISVTNCSLHNFEVTGSRAFNVTSTSGSVITFSNNIVYNIANEHIINIASTGVQTYNNNLLIANINSSTILSIADVGSTYTNNTICSSANVGINVSESGAVTLGTFSGNTSHTNNGVGISFGASRNGTATSCAAWRNGGSGLQIGPSTIGITFDTGSIFGNTTNNINVNGAANCDIKFISYTVNGDTSFSSSYGFRASNGGSANIYFESCNFGSASGIKTTHTTADFDPSGAANRFILRNTILASTTEVASISTAISVQMVSQKHDGTSGNNKGWFTYGTSIIDTTIFNTASPSLRLTPNNASNKFQSAPWEGAGFKTSVASGATATISVYVRKSSAGDGTAYTGNQPRLIVRKNLAAGITSDTVLATAAAATGSWEQLSGTTIAVSEDCSLEFFVDCDGTAGWVNIDDFNVSSTATDSKGFKYWIDGYPMIYANNTSGSGGGSYVFIG